MGGTNKLLATIGGKPLVRMAVEAALASHAAPVTVVTGHDAGAVESALTGLAVAFAHNPNYAAGLSTSLRAGLAALPAGVDGVVVMLADMPDVGPAVIDRLIEAFAPKPCGNRGARLGGQARQPGPVGRALLWPACSDRGRYRRTA